MQTILRLLFPDVPVCPKNCKGAFHQWLSRKGRDYTDLMVPTAIRQPERPRALAAKEKLVRKRYQKLGDLTEINGTITNKVTHLSNWWTELTLSIRIMVAGEDAEEADLKIW